MNMKFKNVDYLLAVFLFALLYIMPVFARWKAQQSGTTVNLSDVKMLDQMTAIAVGDSGVILKTTDGGQHWVKTFSHSSTNWYAVAFKNDLEGIAVGKQQTMATTIDGGDTWSYSDSSGSPDYISAAYNSDGSLFIGNDTGSVIYSLDNGTTWKKIDFSTGPITSISFSMDTQSGLLTNSYTGYETADNGTSWQQQYLPLTSWGITFGCAIAPESQVKYIAGAEEQFAILPAIMRQTEPDSSWQAYQFMPAMPSYSLMDVSAPTANTAYSCGSQGIIISTADSGKTWKVNKPVTSQNLSAIDFYDDSTGAAVGYAGTILFASTGEVTQTITGNETIPDNFMLHQNYPNPFNSQTTIGFSLARPSHVVMTLFAINGEKVATITNRSYGAGDFTIQFDASALSAGVYFYQLRAGNQVRTKKMIYLP